MAMRTVVILLALAASLAACAGEDESVSDRFAGARRVRGDADGVTVLQAGSVAEALPLAIGHCSHFKKSAQYAGRDGAAFRFRCVPG